MTALSSADPGRPIDWQTESRWQAARNAPAVYSLPRSEWKMTPGTWPPRTATAMASAPETKPSAATEQSITLIVCAVVGLEDVDTGACEFEGAGGEAGSDGHLVLRVRHVNRNTLQTTERQPVADQVGNVSRRIAIRSHQQVSLAITALPPRQQGGDRRRHVRLEQGAAIRSTQPAHQLSGLSQESHHAIAASDLAPVLVA